MSGIHDGFSLIWCKSVSINKSSNGAIRMNLSFISFKSGNVKYNQLFTIGIGDEIRMYGITFVCMSRNDDNLYSSVSLVNKDSLEEKRLTRQMVFKSVPNQLVEAANHSIVDTLQVPDINNPDVQIFINHIDNVDSYGNWGWKTDDILKEVCQELNINLFLPDLMDYYVSNTVLNVGSTLMQIITNLFPIPGLVMSYGSGDSFSDESYTTIHVNGATSYSEFTSFVRSLNPCEITSMGANYKKYYYKVEGAQAEPIAINTDTDTVYDMNSSDFNGLLDSNLTWNVGIIYNLFGRVFGFSYLESETYSHRKMLKLPEDLSDTMLTL